MLLCVRGFWGWRGSWRLVMCDGDDDDDSGCGVDGGGEMRGVFVWTCVAYIGVKLL